MTLRFPVVGPDEQVVPKHPNENMRGEGADWAEYKDGDDEKLDDIDKFVATRVYKATLSAAPAPQYAEVTEEDRRAMQRAVAKAQGWGEKEIDAAIGYADAGEPSFTWQEVCDAVDAVLQFLSTKLNTKQEG